MATLNVGAMAARLGLDPSDFLDKMKGVQGFNGFASAEMSRQWKKTGRDGQEGIRLIDEALGIHVARPVARIVAETFPALSKAISGILPGVAFGAVATAIFEFVSGISRKMDEAKRKQEEYTEAVQRTKLVIGEGDAAAEQHLDKALAKAAALRKDPKAEAHFKGLVADAEAVDQMAKSVDKLVEAELKEARAAAARQQLWAAASKAAHDFFSFESTLKIEEINNALEGFGREFDVRSVEDQVNHTTTAFSYLTAEAKRAHEELAALQLNAGKTVTIQMGLPFMSVPKTLDLAPKDVIDAAKKRADTFDAIMEETKRRQKAADQDKANDAAEAGRHHADQVKSEVEQLQRLIDTSRAAALSAEQLAAATGKGTAATILATAAAEAEKKYLDAKAGVKPEVANDRSVQSKLAELAIAERTNTLTEQGAKAVEEFNRALGEQATHAAERVTALTGAAEGHGRVATEQAKELATLIPLEKGLKGLKELYASVTSAGGQPSPFAAALKTQIASAEAALKGASGQINEVINPKIQQGAFSGEIDKVKRQIETLAGGEVSPWAKIDAEVLTLTRDLQLTPPQIAQLHEALSDLQKVKIAGEFEKLNDRIEQTTASTAAFAAGSPYAKIDAEVVKLASDLGLSAEQTKMVRAGLIAIQSIENAGKVFGAADAFNSGGAKMQELRQQMEALQRAASSGHTDDGTALSSEALSAVKLEMQAVAAEEDQILLKTGGIADGFRAWANELQRLKTEGQFTFEMLGQASKSFEDSASKSIFDVLELQRKKGETTRQEHRRLMNELRSMWAGYFNSLAQMALKHQFDKLLAPIANSAAGKLGGVFGKADPAAQATGAAGLTAAGATLQTAGTSLVAAALALRAGALSGSSGGALGGALGAVSSTPIPFFAGGGDATPGSDFISGEAGAERVSLDRSGGAHITPLGFTTSGKGDTHIHQDFRGAVVSEDLLRKADAARMMSHTKSQAVGEAIANMSEISRRSLKGR